jgi:hypothetical protein
MDREGLMRVTLLATLLMLLGLSLFTWTGSPVQSAPGVRAMDGQFPPFPPKP